MDTRPGDYYGGRNDKGIHASVGQAEDGTFATAAARVVLEELYWRLVSWMASPEYTGIGKVESHD